MNCFLGGLDFLSGVGSNDFLSGVCALGAITRGGLIELLQYIEKVLS